MLEGNVCAPIRLATEHVGGAVLDLCFLIKHLELHVPPVSALLCCDTLPLFEDVEIIVLMFRIWLGGFKVVLVLGW